MLSNTDGPGYHRQLGTSAGCVWIFAFVGKVFVFVVGVSLEHIFYGFNVCHKYICILIQGKGPGGVNQMRDYPWDEGPDHFDCGQVFVFVVGVSLEHIFYIYICIMIQGKDHGV